MHRKSFFSTLPTIRIFKFNEMSTTTKRKRDEADNEGPPNKKIKNEDTSQSNRLSMELMPELWLHILVFISYRTIGSIRLVCRQWNEMTHSKDYGKALCIRKFGHDIGPLKIINLASLSKVADSELVFIPTIQEGSKLSVDWFAYYEARMLLRDSIRDIMEQSDEGLSEDEDLTYSIINKIVFITYSDEAEYSTRALLLKLLPVIVQYNRIDLASRTLFLLGTNSADYSLPKQIDQWLDLYEIAETHFPDRSNYVLRMACEASSDYYVLKRPGYKIKLRLQHYCEQVLPRLLHTLIQRRSEQLESYEEDIKSIILLKGERVNFPIIFQSTNQDVPFIDAIHSTIVSICQKEFELTNDWRMKECALLAACVSSCVHDGYKYECIKFATKVVSNKQHHKRVLQAAAVLLCSKLTNSNVQLSQDEFDLVFEHLIWASLEVEPKYVLTIINRLVSILVMNKNNTSQDKLDLFHATLFKALLVPGVISDSITDTLIVNDTLYFKFFELGEAFGQQLQKYLAQYRETYFKLASLGSNFLGALTPAHLVACYLVLGPLADEKNFHLEADNIVKQVQDGTIGFEIDVAEFHAHCPYDSLAAPSTDPKALIESILKLVPKEVIEPLHKDEEALAALEIDQNEDNEEVEEDFPNYIPHFKHQYDEALSKMHQIDSSEWPKSFNFSTTPKSSMKLAFSEPTVFAEDIQMALSGNMVALDGVTSLVDICAEFADSTEPEEKELVKEFAPKILSLLINCMGMDSILARNDWVSGAKILLQEISEGYSLAILAFYLTALLDALDNKAMIESISEFPTQQPMVELKDYVREHHLIHHIILSKFTDPPVNLLSKYFDMLFCFDRRHNKYWIDKLKALEDIILQWPRTAWIALRNAAVAQDLLLDEYRPDTQEDAVGRKLVWQLMMKYYGYKMVAGLVSHLKRVNLPAGYFYEHAAGWLRQLDTRHLCDIELEDHAKEILPKFAIFCHLYQIDKNAGDVCFFNQFITDQSNIGQILNTINPELVTEELNGNYFSLFF